VKAMEEVLDGWNEYRLAINNLGKAGRKLAGALKDLVGCMDKTNVSGMSMPTAHMTNTPHRPYLVRWVRGPLTPAPLRP
jgi:hypothetical protein